MADIISISCSSTPRQQITARSERIPLGLMIPVGLMILSRGQLGNLYIVAIVGTCNRELRRLRKFRQHCLILIVVAAGNPFQRNICSLLPVNRAIGTVAGGVGKHGCRCRVPGENRSGVLCDRCTNCASSPVRVRCDRHRRLAAANSPHSAMTAVECGK